MSEKKIIPITPKSKIKDPKITTTHLYGMFLEHEDRIVKIEDDKALVVALKEQVDGVIETQSNIEKTVEGLKTKIDEIRTSLDEKIDGIKDYLKSEIKGMAINSKTFRIWLVGGVLTLIVFTGGFIWKSLDTGLYYYREDKKVFEAKIEAKVIKIQESVDKFGDKLDSKFDKLIEKVIENSKG